VRAIVSGLAGLAAAVAVPAVTGAETASVVCAACVQANMQRLAGDELRGRRCGTADEAAAADYIVQQLTASHVPGALPGGAYVQSVQLATPTYAAPPTLTLKTAGAEVRLVQGEDMALENEPALLDAPSVRIADTAAGLESVAGKLVVYDGPAFDPAALAALRKAGALGVVMPAPDALLQHWTAAYAESIVRSAGPTRVVGAEPPAARAPWGGPTVVLVKPQAMARLRAADGGTAHLDARRGPDRLETTHNVVGVIHGAAPDADRRAVLLSAHYDHLGVRGGVIFHGANDDASGTSAVLEFARILGAGATPQRTVYFGLFGCEEAGELGSLYFQGHPPTALSDIAVNLEFEMIGVDDPKHAGQLMLTGWERSNLGPALKAHGALVGPDPYPEQHFFQRSDNFQLAKKGVVAHTLSAWPLPPTYHAATDDLDHVDLAFMDRVIGSLVEPVRWLVNNGDFEPAWVPGQAP
jgi:hypothetical protein